jgi:hypothetical protein
VTLPAGAAISTALTVPGDEPRAQTPGPLHGQIWLRLPASTNGTLTVQTTAPDAAGSDHFDIDLSTVSAGTWTRVWLYRSPGGAGNELTTNGQSGTLRLLNSGTAEIQLYAWGLDLTQIGGPTALGALDPGPMMYDGSLKVNEWLWAIDALDLPPITTDTSATGFCLSVDVQPALSWAPFATRRTLAKWTHDEQPLSATLYGTANDDWICFNVTGAVFDPCMKPLEGPGWGPGETHNVKGCVDAAGGVSIYADDAAVGNSTTGAAFTSLAGGRLRVGGDGVGVNETPWHGYVSKVLACFGRTGCQ